MKINTYQLTYDPMGLTESITPAYAEQQVPYGENIVYDKDSIITEYAFDMILVGDEINDVNGMLEQSRLCHMDFDEMHGFFYVTKFDKSWVKMIDSLRVVSYTLSGYYLGHRPYLKLTWFRNHHKTDFNVPTLNETLIPADYVTRVSQWASYQLMGTDGLVNYYDSPPGKIKFKATDDIFMNGCIHATEFNNQLDLSTYANWFTSNVATGGDTKKSTVGFFRVESDNEYSSYTNTLTADQSACQSTATWSPVGGLDSYNYLPENTDAEDTTLNRVGAQASTLTNTNEQQWERGRSYKVVTNNVASGEGLNVNMPHAVWNGGQYTVSAYVRGASASGSVQMVMHRYNIDGGWIGQSLGTAVNLTTSWQRISVTVTVDATAHSIAPGVYTSTKQATTFYVDGLQSNAGATPLAWIRGGTPNRETVVVKTPASQKRFMRLLSTPTDTDYADIYARGITDVSFVGTTCLEFESWDLLQTHVELAHQAGLKIHLELSPWYNQGGNTFLDPNYYQTFISDTCTKAFTKCPDLDGFILADYFYPGMYQTYGDATQRTILNNVAELAYQTVHAIDETKTFGITLSQYWGKNSAYAVDLRYHSDFIIATITRGWDDTPYSTQITHYKWFNVLQKSVDDEITWLIPMLTMFGDPSYTSSNKLDPFLIYLDIALMSSLNGAGYMINGWPYYNSDIKFTRLAVQGEECLAHICQSYDSNDGFQFTGSWPLSGTRTGSAYVLSTPYSKPSLSVGGYSGGSQQTGNGTWQRLYGGGNPPSDLYFKIFNNDSGSNRPKRILFADCLMELSGTDLKQPWIPGQETNTPYAILGDNTLFGQDVNLVRDTVTKYSGTGSIKVNPLGRGGNEGVALVGENLTPSQNFTVSGKVMVNNGSTYRLTITDGLSYTYTSGDLTGNGGWQSFSHTDTTTANGTLYYILYYTNNTNTNPIRVDELMLSEGNVALTWAPAQSTMVFRPVMDQVFYNKKTENDIVINNKLFYFQFHKQDATKICSIYDLSGRKVLVLSDETNNILSDDFNMKLNPFETVVETGNSNFRIKLGMEFFEIESIGTPVRYPQKRFIVASSPFIAYGYQEAIQITSATMLIDRSVGTYAPQLNYSVTPSFMHWEPGENLSFESITNVKNVHPNDGFNDETYKNFIGITGFTPKLFTSDTAVCLNMSRMTDGATYGGTVKYNQGKYGSRNSWYFKGVNGMKYTVYAMIKNSDGTHGSSFDFWIDGASKGKVTVGAGTYSRFVHLGDFISNGNTQTFTYTPKDKTYYTGFHYMLIVPKSGGFSWDVLNSTSPYRLRELALSDLKMAFEVGD